MNAKPMVRPILAIAASYAAWVVAPAVSSSAIAWPSVHYNRSVSIEPPAMRSRSGQPYSRRLRLAALALAYFVVVSAHADVIVATSGTFTAAYLELEPALEQVVGDEIVTAATSIGAGADSIPSRLARGEAIDVVIASDAVLARLIEDGLVVADSRVELARSAIGIAVRTGAPKPDIATVDALRQALLDAESIAYSGSVSGTYVSTELFPRLGIAEQVAAKSRKIEGERVGAVVARGEAEIGFQQISELKPIAGLELLGPLPAEVQRVTVFSAGVATASRQPQAARALIEYLASPAAAPAVTESGLEPINRGAAAR